MSRDISGRDFLERIETHWLTRPGFLNSFGIHIDTINQEVYNKVHTNPKTLRKKIQGYQNLLEAGYPPEQTWACIC